MSFMSDLRYAFRQFVHAPGFAGTAVLTLALGIGATTAIFTLAHAVLLKSLPVSRPEELIRIGDNENCCVNGGMQGNWSLFSYDKYLTFREGTPEFTELAAFQAGRSRAGVRRSRQRRRRRSRAGSSTSPATTSRCSASAPTRDACLTRPRTRYAEPSPSR